MIRGLEVVVVGKHFCFAVSVDAVVSVFARESCLVLMQRRAAFPFCCRVHSCHSYGEEES
jgi:hypothetical protein